MSSCVDMEIESICHNQEYDVMCRLCMGVKGDMRNIFMCYGCTDAIEATTRVSASATLTIPQMIQSFAGEIQIIENDGLPSQICAECIENTQRSFQFKRQCEYSDTRLRNYIKRNAANEQMDKLHQDEFEYNNTNFSTNLENQLGSSKTKNRKCKMKKIKSNKNIKKLSHNNLEKLSSKKNNDRSFSCSECSLSFLKLKDLKIHTKNNHKTDMKFTCDICNQNFIFLQSLSRHKRIHQENRRNNLCTICGKGFHRTDDLKRHIRIHTNERPYACTLCPKSYKQSSELTDHLNSHSLNKNFICTVCGKSLFSRNGLYVHMKAHRGEKNHICKICGNKYVTTGELTSHIKHIHSQAKPYICSFNGCSRAFVTKLSLKTHIRSHTGEKPYQCLVCNKFLATASSLHEHKRTHTGEKLKKCDLCELKLGNAQALKKHLRRHSGERPYRCNICLDTFICNSSLNTHMKIKHMEKEHQCLECKKMFALPSKLRQHMKIHDRTVESKQEINDKDTNDIRVTRESFTNDSLSLEFNKSSCSYQDCKNNQLQQNKECVKLLQHHAGLNELSNNQIIQKMLFNSNEENKKRIQLPLGTQIAPLTHVNIQQSMIVPHFLK